MTPITQIRRQRIFEVKDLARMKGIYKKLFLIIFSTILSAPFSAFASHVFGADIEWQSLGNDSFEIIVHAYRDCNGMTIAGNNLTYQTYDETCVKNPITPQTNLCCGTDITPICNNSCDRCSGGPSCNFAYGIEEFIITSVVYLPPPCCKYTIAWQENSRSSTITTGAADDNLYIEDYLDRCIKPTSSSPYFSTPPITIFCVNQCIVYNSGVADHGVDSAGRADSLSFRLAPPQSDHGTDIQYSSPYSYDAPVIFAGTSKKQAFVLPYCYGFHLDSANGDMEFKAVKTDITDYVIAVDIYRRDSKGIEQNIGEIKRDIEMIILDCPSDIPPVVTGINGGSSYSIHICTDQQTCFNIKAFDLKPSDTVKMTWNNPGTMDGATFTALPNGQKWPTSVFCWSPKKSDIRSYPYTFVATATDNICPVPGRASSVFSIYVNGPPPIANYSATVQKCGLVDFQANVASNSPSTIASYRWTGDSTMGAKPLKINSKTGSYQYNSPGTYHYTLIVTGPNGCATIYKDSVIIPKIPTIKIPKDTTVCTKTSLTINATPSNYLNPYKIFWNTGDSGAIVHQNIVKYTILVAGIKDATGCTIYDTMRITASIPPIAETGLNNSICIGYTIFIGTSKVQGDSYLWTSNPSGFSSSVSHPDVEPTTTTTYILKETNSSGCSATDSVIITVDPLPNAHWTMNYFHNEALFRASDSMALSYQWTFGDSTAGAGNNIKHLYGSGKNYTVNLTIVDSNQCQNEFDSTINFYALGIETFRLANLLIEVFPNPFSSSTTVKYTLNKPSKISIALFDVTGRQIATVANTILDIGSYQTEINAEKYNLNPGVYFLKIMTDDGYISRQIVKL